MKSTLAQQLNKKKLSEVCEIFSGGTPSTIKEEYWNGDIFWLSSGETRNNFIINTERKITLSGVENSSTRLAKKHDVVVASAGQGNTRGQVSLCLIDTYVNQSIIVLRTNNEIILPRFLFYNLKSRYQELRQLSDSHSSRGSLPKNVLSVVNIMFPSLHQQQKIVKILSDLDNKIQNLQRQNKILEQIAQTVFKSWFVDYDGITEFEDSELGRIPKGWSTESLDENINFLNGLALQKFRPMNEKFLPVIKIREMKEGISDKTEKAGLHIDPKYIIKKGDVLFSWSGSLKLTIWHHEDGALNQHIFKVTSEKYKKWFFYQWIKLHLPEFRRIAEGKVTTMGHIQRYHLTERKILVPSSKTLEKYNSIFQSLFNQILLNKLESESLRKICDTLLPKLMSGEIRV